MIEATQHAGMSIIPQFQNLKKKKNRSLIFTLPLNKIVCHLQNMAKSCSEYKATKYLPLKINQRKANTQKSLAFLYTNNEKTEREGNNTIHHCNKKNKILKSIST